MGSSTSAAVRFLTGSKKAAHGNMQLRLHVHPGTSKTREGIRAITDDNIEICVAAQARDGKANIAVVDILSEALGLSKSKFTLTHGAKSRDKTITLSEVQGDGPSYASTILEQLQKAIVKT